MTSEQIHSMGLKRARIVTDIRVSNVVVVAEGPITLTDNLMRVDTLKGPVFVDVKSIVMVTKI